MTGSPTVRPDRVLLVTGGHPFEREPLLAMFAANDAIVVEHVEHPAARERLHPDRLGDIDAIVFYDMPGVRFTRGDPPVEAVPPDPAVVAGIEALLARGVGMVMLHHSIASWPAWPRWADIVGGRFHYAPGHLAGVDYPDSGYLLDVEHTVEVLAPDHPVCAGVPATFTLRDELYLAPVTIDLADPQTVPLLRTTFPLELEHFHSTDRTLRGRPDDRAGWSHPTGAHLPGADLLGWARTVEASPTVYLQPGDGPSAYADPVYRRLLANAISWVAATSRTRGSG